MKKLALAGIVSILAPVALSGCMSVPEEEDTTVPADETTPVVEEIVEEVEEEVEEEVLSPISYSTEGIEVEVTEETMPVDFTAEQLETLASECATEHEEGYFEDLVAKFEGTEKTVYSFKYLGDSQESDTYIVTLVPNKAGYGTLDEFKNDFDQCFAGGDAYPKMLNEDWLLFVNSCGSGFNDGSDNPIGCAVVQEAVDPTLELN